MQKSWHSLKLEDIFGRLNCGREGIIDQEAVIRLEKYGHNILPSKKPYSKARLFFDQLNSPLMYILLATVIISLLLKNYSDTIFIIIVVFINSAVGFYQENKANESLFALKKVVKVKARVWRGGREKEIDSEELTAGDIIFLKAGDKVPADGRIIKSKGLKINEATLTGEWQAVKKNVSDNILESAPVPERINMVFMGTIVEEGQAMTLIVATGIATEIGKIVSLLTKTKELKTPLQKKIVSLSRVLGAFIISTIFAIIGIGYFVGKPFADIFVAALALAVSAIPEGLLPAITVILVLGMRRILKQNGLIKKLAATETLGSVTVICTDKTGTLTEGKMQVSHILTSTNELINNNVNGFFVRDNIDGVESHILALKIAMLANDAFVENPEAELQEWIIRGRPTEKALLLAGMQFGLSKENLEAQYPVLDRVSFESDHKFAATFHRKNGNKKMLYVLGAPEEIIARSISLDVDGRTEKLGVIQKSKLINKLEVLAQKGLRVLACAHKNYNSEVKYQNLVDLVQNLSLVGFIALKDPLRKDARNSILIAKKAGIRSLIVTGDHKFTAKAIAEEIGLAAGDENILEGKELETISDDELKEKSKTISIYARVSPSHKLKIVNALQANGEVVAMLGDGINDAPALKSADVGVAVGSGTDVAKEVADLVLLDDNFKTIIKTIEEGRVIFGNTRKVFIYFVADDFSEIFLFLIAMILRFPIPLLAAQILWINLVEDSFPAMALTTEQGDRGMMDERPRKPEEPILNKPMKLWMAAIFLITGMAAVSSFFFIWKLTGDLHKTRTMVFVLMCVDSLFFAFSVRSFRRTIFRKDIFSNRYLVGAVAIAFLLLLGAVYLPFLQKVLSTRPMNAIEWAFVFGISFIEILLVEFFKKKIFNR